MITFIHSDFFNAFYEYGILKHEGDPDYLNTETVITLFPQADVYYMPMEVYDELLNGEGYPHFLSDLPLELLER